ncbi:MAG: arginine--tRNA ligase, partial [Candidatus Puniceispirillales bacterium]
AGSQIEKLIESSLLRYDECNGKNIKEIPDGLYPGEYLKEVGKALLIKYGKNLKQNSKKNVFDLVRKVSLEVIMNMIKEDLYKLGIEMDVFTSEKKYHFRNFVDGYINHTRE